MLYTGLVSFWYPPVITKKKLKEINAEMPHLSRGVIMLDNVASPYNVKFLLGFYKFRIPAKV
jgi:hypothetical protein